MGNHNLNKWGIYDPLRQKISAECETMEEKKKPVSSYKCGAIDVAVWEQESKEGNKFYTITMNRSYKDGEEWKKTTSIRGQDVMDVIVCLNKAYEFIRLRD